nr:exodeoxyribonuclease VII small subunit [Shewanella basaltis]
MIYLVTRAKRGILSVVKKTENLSFEQSLAELETIVAHLEQGEVSLDDALKQFERGITLVRQSQTKLEQAQQKVSILLNENDVELTPFSVESE